MAMVARSNLILFLLFAVAFCNAQERVLVRKQSAVQTDTVLVAAYYAAWDHTAYPPDSIDWSGMDYLIHFAVQPTETGGIDDASLQISHARSVEFTTKAHSEGVKILLCIGGAAALTFPTATNAIYIDALVQALVDTIVSRGYDGYDLDWESNVVEAQWESFAFKMDSALAAISDTLLTTCYHSPSNELYDAIDYFDYVHLWSYDLSWPFGGDWVSWHNSPLYDNGYTFPQTGGLVPSINAKVDTIVAHGVPLSKIMIGTDWNGYDWSGSGGADSGGVTKPRDEYDEDTYGIPSLAYDVPYSQLYDTYYWEEELWDGVAQAAYYSVNYSWDENDHFVSVDGVLTQWAKIRYVRDKNVAGIFVWDLSSGWNANDRENNKNRMLTALYLAKSGADSADMPYDTTWKSYSQAAEDLPFVHAFDGVIYADAALETEWQHTGGWGTTYNDNYTTDKESGTASISVSQGQYGALCFTFYADTTVAQIFGPDTNGFDTLSCYVKNTTGAAFGIEIQELKRSGDAYAVITTWSIPNNTNWNYFAIAVSDLHELMAGFRMKSNYSGTATYLVDNLKFIKNP